QPPLDTKSIENPIKGLDKGVLGRQAVGVARPQPLDIAVKKGATIRAKAIADHGDLLGHIHFLITKEKLSWWLMISRLGWRRGQRQRHPGEAAQSLPRQRRTRQRQRHQSRQGGQSRHAAAPEVAGAQAEAETPESPQRQSRHRRRGGRGRSAEGTRVGRVGGRRFTPPRHPVVSEWARKCSDPVLATGEVSVLARLAGGGALGLKSLPKRAANIRRHSSGTRLSACQPESVTGPGFTARLDNQRDLPKFRAKARMTAELLFKHIDKIVQSDASVLSSNFSIRLLKAWVPRGGCALENKHLEERHAFSKHYVRITNTDKRCLLRALVVACAYLQFVAKRITEQTKLATELQIEAGLYTATILVYECTGQRRPTRCIFNLPGTEILHLHLVEQHFNVVTKLPAFFGSDHYCAKCEMAYDCNYEKHKCADACSTCKTPGSNCKAKRAYCGYAKCPVCKQYDETATHECFVTPPKAKESSAPYVYYDFETYVDSGKQHRVHLVTAATSCEACPKLFPRPRCSGAIAIAHNGSAYDAFLLLGALLNGLAKKKPQVIFQNSRLMYMKCDKITFKDSLNFIPIGLAQFPKALGLGTQLTKGDFPHVFNQPQNWGYVGPYCSIDMYGGKKNKQHDSIADWLAKQEGQVFNFNKEYLDYCLQDTLILREGCLKYTRLIKDICGLDAFVQSNTIAGLAMAHDYQGEGAPVQQPIRLEEALFGGRTEAFVPHAEATETVELRYRDVLKAESSGSPGMTEDAKAAYMASFFEREGVRLEKVEENPGLRFVAKIFLNSLWGKFCQRDDLTSTEIVDSYEAWLQRLTDPSIKVKSCEPIGESFMMLEYKPRIGVAGERAFKYANVPIGVFTTSHARLRLYEALEGLGTRVIYADTDSVVYPVLSGRVRASGGSSLGQWTDEVPAGCRMVQFTTGGPKLYRYVVEKPDGSLYSVLKCKGIRVTPEIAEREAELQEILRHGGLYGCPRHSSGATRPAVQFGPWRWIRHSSAS
uniref:DNA-directed DNA polymerase n=1 Tax=Macrostomum lignano TaxID=282301 RepID=A0A1I8F3I2_9PLAT